MALLVVRPPMGSWI